MSPDSFISQLYRESSLISLAEFPAWALDLLRQVIPFDGAIWGTGHQSTHTFHTEVAVDIATDIFSQLQKYQPENPIFERLFLYEGQAVDMREVLSDEVFYHSNLYHQCFKPFGIERILSSIHFDHRSGIFTLLTLYRYERNHCFTTQEKTIQNRLLYHLLSAASHRQLMSINTATDNFTCNNQSALCDSEGIYHSVNPSFLDVLDLHCRQKTPQKFPFPILANRETFSVDLLQFSQQKLGDLYKISVRVKNQFDELTARELQVVDGICQGNTFKQIARSLQLSPSTVSNHLYRIYLKLGINTRSELVTLANKLGY